MTARKELYIKIKEQLSAIPELEYIDIYRGQFDNLEHQYPNIYTATLIRINAINYEDMTQGIQEGKATIDVLFYCKDGFVDQMSGTADADAGLIEIELLDTISDKINNLKGDSFTPLSLTSEQSLLLNDFMSYTLTFDTTIYKQTVNPIKKIQLQNIDLNLD